MTAAAFDYSLDFKSINFRERPDLYRVGKGEQGVLLVEPYKGELLPHWRFKTFLAYLKAEDFPGADMARKFLQMGWTRARRYANHKGGRKYDQQTGAELPRTEDTEKAAAAAERSRNAVSGRRRVAMSSRSNRMTDFTRIPRPRRGSRRMPNSC
jgi:hypothetical protein